MPVIIKELQSTIPGAENPMQVTCKVLVDDQEIDTAIPIISITIQRAVQKIPSATIVISDGDVSLQTFPISNQDLFMPGKKISIALGYQTEAEPMFTGIITGHANRIRNQQTELVITCKDAAVKMTLQRRNAHYNDVTDSDLATTLIGRYPGLTAEIESTAVQHQNLVQYHTSDWDYMLQRLDLAGLLCYVEDGVIRAEKTDLQQDRVLDIVYGATLQQFEASIDARLQPTAVQGYSWSYANQDMTTADAAEPALQPAGNITSAQLASAMGYETIEIRHNGAVAADALQAIADARMQKQRLAAIQGEVVFQGVATAKPGKFIVVAGVGDRFSGPLFVRSVTHRFEDGNWLTEAGLGLEPTWYAEAINPHHPTAAMGMLPAVQGLHIGVVEDLEDPLGESRIKIRLPAINGSEPGVWARQATLDAGADRGTCFRPEISDEVVVGFLGDDPANPIILGMLHSSNRTPPIPASSSNDEKGYKSRGGFQMIFHDGDNAFTLQSPGGRKIVIDDTAGVITIDDGTGNTMTMDNSGVSVESATNMTIKAGTSIKLEAASISISASGQLELKGAIVKIN